MCCDAQREYFAARLQQIDQFRDVRIQEAMIDGFLLEGGLMAAQGPTPRRSHRFRSETREKDGNWKSGSQRTVWFPLHCISKPT